MRSLRRGNDFAKKITYKSWNPETKRHEKSEHLIAEPSGARSTRSRRAREGERGGARQFRTSPQLRIAVAVAMIATGTDITAPRRSAFAKRGAISQSPAESRDNPLECLLFLRDIRSRAYFEQMKGRGTRVLSPTDLQAVSGADARAKTHFVIVDAVGVCESDKTESRPLEKKPSVAFDAISCSVSPSAKATKTPSRPLPGASPGWGGNWTKPQSRRLKKLTNCQSLGQMSAGLLRSLDPDVIAECATGKPGVAP